MNEVALIIIYNHQYNKNIEILEKIYTGRFAHIYHLVPFYTGDVKNVIPVYENSFYFQGYIAQGFNYFFDKKFKHYLFVADDLMIKPVINENNYQQYFKLKDNSCFIPNFITLSDVKGRWHRLGEASTYNMKGQGVEAESQLPKYDDAVKHFNKHGLKVEPLHFDQIYGEKKLKYCRSMHDFIEYFRYKIKAKKQRHKPVHLQYPLVGSYSDIFVVSSDAIRLFCHYCGVFASTNLFVELGLPTAMVLCAENIVQEKDLDFYGIGLWNEEDWKIVEKYRSNLQALLSDFPKELLYIHPIKLSQWNK